MIYTIVACAGLAAWLYLIVARGGFWQASVVEDCAMPRGPSVWPPVVAVVPARDEAEVIADSLSSLLDQEYPGRFAIILVDDQSTDGTAAVARAAAARRPERSLTVLPGRPLPGGWTGKIWAMKQGADQAERLADPPRYLLFCDADIAFAADALRRLVARADAQGLALTSLMAKLRCQSVAERSLIPAFVFFFQMLYPFQWVNRPDRAIAAAAGGCMLVGRRELQAAGGFATIRDQLIDDCALARVLKRVGPIWLGLTERVRSLRPYPSVRDVGRMIARSAYEQLGRSPLRLAGTVAAMGVTYLAPPLLALFASGEARFIGAGTWLLMALTYQPMLRFYRVNPLWGGVLPLIAGAYMVFTLFSAYQYASGKGGYWKGRVGANASELE